MRRKTSLQDEEKKLRRAMKGPKFGCVVKYKKSIIPYLIELGVLERVKWSGKGAPSSGYGYVLQLPLGSSDA